MLAEFTGRLGLSIDELTSGAEVETESMAIVSKLVGEPDEEALLVSQIKSQNKEQKAQQSYEDNMEFQGFGSTFASGFYSTTTSGFGAAAARPQSAFMTEGDGFGHTEINTQPLMTEGDISDEDEHRAQMEFEQSMRATSMSFFKTAKSTFMSTNDFHSQAWGADQSTIAGRAEEPRAVFEYASAEGSDLAANAEQIIAGGSMSILRRKGR